MEVQVIRRRALPVLLLVAFLRFSVVGCGGPEAFRSRDNPASGAAGNVGGNPGSARLTGSAGLPGQGGSGTAGDTVGMDGSGLAGAGQAGIGPDGGAAGASVGSGGTGVAGFDDAGIGGTAGTGGSAGMAGGTPGQDGAAGVAGIAGSGGAAGTNAVNYCDHTQWTATASTGAAQGGGGPPSAGIDGDLTTRWATNRPQNNTDYYQVDFGGMVKLTKITLVISPTMYDSDYPQMYAIYGSTDGTTFGTTPFATGSGIMTPMMPISFTQQTVRAVRVNQTGSNGTGNWWQFAEFQVDCTL
jgi:hypothetical protein